MTRQRPGTRPDALATGARFEQFFQRVAEIEQSAPGRVNLAGEHADFNGGFCLPTPVPQRTRVAVARRSDHGVSVATANLPDSPPERYALGEERPGRSWLDYPKAVTATLSAHGAAIGGFDAIVTSELPLGGGLGSGAALLVALFRALRELFLLELEDEDVAVLAHRAEEEFIGARAGGLMDSAAASLGLEHYALYLDTRDLSYRQVPMPTGTELIVIDSGIERPHAGAALATRQAECETAVRLLRIAHLRDIGIRDFGKVAMLPEPLARRVRHVVTENARVAKAVAAMEADQLDALGLCLDESHRSLRDDFEVATPEIDALVSLLRQQPGVFGARLAGDYLGGAVIAVADAGTGDRAARRAVARYARLTGRDPRILMPSPAEEPVDDR